jgi:hypothetical protein
MSFAGSLRARARRTSLYHITPFMPEDRFDETRRCVHLDRLVISNCSFSPQHFVHAPRERKEKRLGSPAAGAVSARERS